MSEFAACKECGFRSPEVTEHDGLCLKCLKAREKQAAKRNRRLRREREKHGATS